ncbi:FERM, ARHGEF and pleckstrin domain-containing protein 1, partial [Xenoophorus captivus]
QRAPGKVLFDLVCVHLNLTEGDYFGLEYTDHRKMTVWLDLLKPALKQIRRPKNTILRFVVKFFPPDHTQLMEELTRYVFPNTETTPIQSRALKIEKMCCFLHWLQSF